MIVNSVVESKAKVLCKEGIAGDGLTLAWAKVSAFCKQDEASCLAAWRSLPVGGKLREFLYERIKIKAENSQPRSLSAYAVLYIMSTTKEQKSLKPVMRELIVANTSIWDLIHNEPGLEDFR